MSVTITHRLSTLKDADVIFAMGDFPLTAKAIDSKALSFVTLVTTMLYGSSLSL
ncbi:hypothetical protein BDZ89DRAFT_1133365 [Hymenopellis radicata]|nr:hypothetical protein BDZ89DRAFT_1133365 [Hymenopellis radicata]